MNATVLEAAAGQAQATLDVSVVIVTWRSRATMEACLASARAGGPREIFVVDNDSADGIEELVGRVAPEAVLVQTGANLGFAPASNIGVARARGEFVLLLNPDASLAPGAMAAMAAFLAANPSVAAVAPLLVDEHGARNPYAAGDLPTLRWAFARHLGIAKLLPGSFRETAASEEKSGPRRVEYLCGAVLMVRRAFFETSGRLDVLLPMYHEDLDLSARIARQGLEAFVLTDVRAHHLGAQSASRSPTRQLLYMMEDGQAPWLYFRRYRGTAAALAFRLIVGAASGLRTAVLSVALAANPSGAARLAPKRDRAGALLKWSVMPKRALEARIDSQFPRASQS